MSIFPNSKSIYFLLSQNINLKNVNVLNFLIEELLKNKLTYEVHMLETIHAFLSSRRGKRVRRIQI